MYIYIYRYIIYIGIRIYTWTRLPVAPARAWMWRPAASPPTKETARMVGSSQMKLTASCVPWIMFRTPAGRPGQRVQTRQWWLIRRIYRGDFRDLVL